MADPPADIVAFAQARPGTEAVVQRIGAHSTQVILVGPSGEWLRAVAASPDEGRAWCERLGVAHHDTWPEELRRKMASYRRSPQDWARAAYPERRT